MTPITETERLLRRWGQDFGARLDTEEREPEEVSTLGQLSVDRSREGDAHTPLTPVRRAEIARRLIQRQNPNCKVPTWAGGDPIRCVQSNSNAAGPWYPDPEAERVEVLVLALYRWDRRASLALRACYCLLGRRPQSERIAWLSRVSETHVSRIAYRAAIGRGRQWLEVQLAMKQTG